MMKYLSIKQTSEKWGITVKRIQVLCIGDVNLVLERLAHIWAISADAEKPDDKRIKSGKYIKKSMDINR